MLCPCWCPVQPWVNTVFWVCKKGSSATKFGEGFCGWLLTSLLSRHGCPRCFELPFLCTLGNHSESCNAPGSPGFHLWCWHSYRLRRAAGCLSKPDSYDISRPIFTQRGVHERSHPTSNTPEDSRSREGSFTSRHQRANVAPLQSSPVRRTPARWLLTKINFSLLSEVGAGLFQMVITFQWEST